MGKRDKINTREQEHESKTGLEIAKKQRPTRGFLSRSAGIHAASSCATICIDLP